MGRLRRYLSHSSAPRRRKGISGTTAGILVVLAVLLAVPFPSGGRAAVFSDSATARSPGVSPDRARGFEGRVSPLVGDDLSGVVTANVNGYGPPPIVAGAPVTVYSAPCPGAIPTIEDCTAVNSTVTNVTGGFGFNVTSGSYYVAVAADAEITGPAYPDGFGGAAVRVTPPNSSIALTVYPFVPYGNTTLDLVNYTCLSAYLNDLDAHGPGCQNPVLSWTQDGAFYINSADEIVFDSFVNATVYPIAPWTPLYQKFPDYAMIPNELGITQDGSYLFAWGTLNSTTTVVTAEAVNVTTHRMFEYNFTSFTTAAVRENGQIELTGWDGNDSQLTVVLANGSVVDHDLWSSTESYVAKFDFFEANNAYWVPDLNGYIDVQADGSASDQIEEWQLTGPSDPILERTYLGTWDSHPGIVVNGVNGVSFNVSSRQLSVQVEWSGLVYQVSGAGTLTRLLEVTDRYPAGTPPREPVGNAAPSDRPTLTLSGPEYGGNYQGFGNNSWLVSMVPGHLGFESTNVSPYVYNGALPFNYAWYQWTQEGAFYNSSYLIAPSSYSCETNNSLCPINGENSYEQGTIWWLWKIGVPEFPNPSSAPMADEESPPATVVTSADANATSITIGWTAPAVANLVNYTVAWGTTSTLGNSSSVPGDQTHYTLSGLEPSTSYNFSVEAWNLHYHGPSAGVRSAVTLPWPFHLTVTATTSSSISLAWDNPVEPFTNLSIDYGTSASNLSSDLSVGTVSAYTVEGLQPETTYFFEIVLWNGTRPGPASSLLEWSTAAPTVVTNFAVSSRTPVSISLDWSVPIEPFTSLNLSYGNSPSNLTSSLDLGDVSQATVSGLTPASSYWFDIVPWNGSQEGTASAEIEGTTLALPTVTNLTISGIALHAISLTWTEPTAPFTNLTVEYGISATNLSENVTVPPGTTTTVADLDAATTYWFAMVAWNGAFEGPVSNEVNGTTASLPAVSSLAVTAVNATWISLAWINPTAPFTNLTLEYGASASDLAIHLSLGAISPAFTVVGLVPGTEYWFEVVPWNGYSVGTGSPEIEATTNALPVVTGLTVTATNFTSVSLAWTDPAEPFTNLTVELGLSPQRLEEPVSVGRASGYTIGNLRSGTDYWFEVVAYDGSVSGPASNEVEAMTEAPLPFLLNASGASGTTVTLSWTGVPANATSLELRGGPVPANLSGIAWLPPVATAITVPGLASHTTYWFELVAYANSTVGRGAKPPAASSYLAYSNEVRVTTAGVASPAAGAVLATPEVWVAGVLVAVALGLVAARWRRGR